MAARLPAICAGCGAKVELRIGATEWSPATRCHRPSEYKLPPAWCDIDSNEQHKCRTDVRGKVVVENSGPRAVRPAGDLANPAERGQPMQTATPVKNPAKRAG